MLKSFALALLGIGVFVAAGHAQENGTHMHIRSHTHMHKETTCLRSCASCLLAAGGPHCVLALLERHSV